MRFITTWMIVFLVLGPMRAGASDPSFVHLVCSVDGAEVRLDGKLFGLTPVQPIQVRAGRHVITITRQGYMNFTKAIHIEAGVTLPVFADLLQEDFGLPELELEPLDQEAPLPSPKKQVLKTSDMPLPELDLMPLEEEMPLPEVEEKAPVVEVPGLILPTEPVPPVATISHGRPWYKSWWFIGGSTGAAVLAGVVAGVVVATQKDTGKGSPPVVIWAP